MAGVHRGTAQAAFFREGKLVQGADESKQVTMIEGMHGLGDCLHQRATVRHFLSLGPVYLSTPWPCIYHDLVDKGLTLIKPNSGLYTQGKNERRQAHLFAPGRPNIRGSQTVRTGYLGGGVIEHGSIIGAMCAGLSTRDFRMPVPDEWIKEASSFLAQRGIHGDFAVMRPLSTRVEYPHLVHRNPDHSAYQAIVAEVRKRMPVVSVADTTNPKIEPIVCDPEADLKVHNGIDFEVLAGIVHLATLAITAPGMMAPLAQAVETPLVCVFGSYENAMSFAGGARYSAYLPIEPIHPAHYLGHTDTPKDIDVLDALRKVGDLVDRLLAVAADLPPRRIIEAAPGPDDVAIDWTGIPDPVKGLFLQEVEVRSLIHLLDGCESVMEIGCQNGRTARVLLNSVLSLKRYIGVDIPPGSVTASSVQRGEVPLRAGEFALGDERFHLMVRPRGSFAIEPYEIIDGGRLDAVFIDGDHSRNGVERDTALALSVLKPGGLVIWHDDHDRSDVDVSAVLDEFNRLQRWDIHRIEGTWIAYHRA